MEQLEHSLTLVTLVGTVDYQRIDRAFHEHGADIVCLYGNAAGAVSYTLLAIDGSLADARS